MQTHSEKDPTQSRVATSKGMSSLPWKTLVLRVFDGLERESSSPNLGLTGLNKEREVLSECFLVQPCT